MSRILVPIAVGLVGSNFLYQFFNHAMWADAFERSYFQLIALGLVGVASLLRPELTERK